MFMPRGPGVVSETIPFEVNGLYRTSVNFTGEGTPARVMLSNPAQATVAFGSLRVGQEAVGGLHACAFGVSLHSFTPKVAMLCVQVLLVMCFLTIRFRVRLLSACRITAAVAAAPRFVV